MNNLKLKRTNINKKNMDYFVEKKYIPADPKNKDDEGYYELVFNLTPFSFYDYVKKKKKAPLKYVPSPFGDGDIPVGKETINMEKFYQHGFEINGVWCRYRGKVFNLILFREQIAGYRGQPSWGRALSILMADFFSDEFVKLDYRTDTKPLALAYNIPFSAHSYAYKAFKGELSYLPHGTKCPYRSRESSDGIEHEEVHFNPKQQIEVGDMDCYMCPLNGNRYGLQTKYRKTGCTTCTMSPFRWPDTKVQTVVVK